MSAPFPVSGSSAPPVLITHEFAPFRGGVATYVREVARAMGRIGGAVEVWTVDYRGRGIDAVSTSAADPTLRCPVVRLAANGRLTPRGLLGFTRSLWQRRRDLRGRPVFLLSVGAQMAFFLLDAIGAVSPERTTCFFHGSEILRFTGHVFWRALARRFYRRAGGFAVNSFHVEQLLRRSGLIPKGAEIAVARCACPTAFAEKSSAGPSTPPDRSWRILTVARLHPRKGQLEVARALSQLPPAQRAQVIYQVVGTGDDGYRQAVSTACREGGVRCEFLGDVPDVDLPAIYACATLYVQASVTLPRSVEGFGITFLEASSQGCPIVAFRSGGVDEAVRDGETGLLVPEGDVPALADAISRLLADPAQRSQMAKAGHAFANEFNWEETARLLTRVGMPLRGTP